MTAAHCKRGDSIELIKAKYIILTNLKEIPERNDNPKEWGYPWYEVRDIKTHERYRINDKTFNIAIITIESNGDTYEDMARIKPANLNEENDQPISNIFLFP